MIAVVAARPPQSLVAACREVAATELWAPPAAPHSLARAAIRVWARDLVDRRYRSDFLLRVAIDAWAAREVRRRAPKLVVASSLAARATFAAARAVGAICVLVVDVPLLRALHRDLDRAAAVWPERRFLRRFRAPAWAIARQEAEHVLADLILVRGAYARSLCLADGLAADRVVTLASPPAPPELPAPAARTGRIRLAGLAAARHGIDTALAAARSLGLELVVRTGDGTEPANLASLPGVAVDDAPVDAIICPAICETYAPELRTTAIPVIASAMASATGRGPDPFDPVAFAAAIASATIQPRDPATPLAAAIQQFWPPSR